METTSQQINIMIDGKQLKTGKDPYTKLPYHRNWFQYFGRIDVPLCNPEIIKNIINKLLSEIEGVRGTYNELKYCWQLEYGTKPIEWTIEPSDNKLRQIINTKKWAALETSLKALEKFPGNIPQYGDELPEPVPIFDNPKWARIEIHLSYDEDKNTIVIIPNRLCGDNSAFHLINRIIKHGLKDEHLINWLKRINYLMFVEGIEYDNKNPILHYLCDEYIARDICTYI
jgi:hypothetical protein